MPCYHPIRAWQLENGTIAFQPGARALIRARALELPCGQCIGCRLERSRQWAIRCMHEASLYTHNCFITLTYDNDHLPRDLSLNKRDWQLFMKRLRRRFFSSNIRFYMCGEYGEGMGRPHYHACLFNHDFRDKLYFKRNADCVLYTSHTLESLWTHGFSLIGDVTFESAAYVARYCTTKITGDQAEKHYALHDKTTGEYFKRTPEFNLMSNRPGIGAPWLHKWLSDAYPRGEILVNGRMSKPPRYYDNLFRNNYDNNDIQYNLIKQRRLNHANLLAGDNTRARRAVKEQVATARNQAKRKTLT